MYVLLLFAFVAVDVLGAWRSCKSVSAQIQAHRKLAVLGHFINRPQAGRWPGSPIHLSAMGLQGYQKS